MKSRARGGAASEGVVSDTDCDIRIKYHATGPGVSARALKPWAPSFVWGSNRTPHLPPGALVKAIVQEGYGSAFDVLTLRDIPTPSIDDKGVLVEVHAASVNALDWHITRGGP